MADTATIRRQASPARWVKAAERAVTEGIEVRQIASTGQWVATSGTQSNVCYLLEVTNGTVTRCTCPAGEYGDPCCKHAARFYLDAGMLDPEPPTPAAPAPAECWACYGTGRHWESTTCPYADNHSGTCPACAATGVVAA